MNLSYFLRNLILSICVLLSFAGCSRRDLANMHPTGTYINAMPEGEKPVHFITQEKDKYGNYFPAYIRLDYTKDIHREIFAYPAPKALIVECEKVFFYSSSSNTTTQVTTFGAGSIRDNFETGKSYYVYCEVYPERKYKVVAEEVGKSDEQEPSNENRVTFITQDKDPNTMWVWMGTQLTGVRNWNKEISNKAELVGPRTQIVVFCKKEGLNFPVQGNFQVGRTYQVLCPAEYTRVGYPQVTITDVTEQK